MSASEWHLTDVQKGEWAHRMVKPTKCFHGLPSKFNTNVCFGQNGKVEGSKVEGFEVGWRNITAR